MQEGRDGLFLAETCATREIEGVDAIERGVASLRDEALDGVDRLRIGGLAQNREMGDGFIHAEPPGGRNGR